jgi:RNA polymerase sigma factor (sigma-70 family)
MDRSDEEIIKEILSEGNSALFNDLFKRYQEKVMNKCFSMTKSRTVSEDLVQDIMIKAMEKLDTFKGKAKFSTWIYAITYNHCIQYLRDNKRLKFDDWAQNLEIPDEVTEEDVEDILDLKSERLTLLLEMLKPEDKALILLKYNEGFDLKKIMYILSLDGESGVKMRLSRAKKRLVALYNQFYPVMDD